MKKKNYWFKCFVLVFMGLAPSITQATFENIPQELLERMIMPHLSIVDLAKMKCVSRGLNAAVRSSIAQLGMQKKIDLLCEAAYRGDVQTVRQLKQSGADCNAEHSDPAYTHDELGNLWTPLMHAVKNNREDCVIALLADEAGVVGADPNDSVCGEFAEAVSLDFALANNNERIACLLINAGAHIHTLTISNLVPQVCGQNALSEVLRCPPEEVAVRGFWHAVTMREGALYEMDDTNELLEASVAHADTGTVQEIINDMSGFFEETEQGLEDSLFCAINWRCNQACTVIVNALTRRHGLERMRQFFRTPEGAAMLQHAIVRGVSF